MLDFWDAILLAVLASTRDYYRERDRQNNRWKEYVQSCKQELLSECSTLVKYVYEATEKQPGVHVHKDLVEGVIQLPLYGFFYVLSRHGHMGKEQKEVLLLFFSNFKIPYSMNQFVDATHSDNYARQKLIETVGISEATAGKFWVQFFKVLYRTDADTTYISKVIDSFGSITMRFAALNGEPEDDLIEFLETFVKSVHTQVVQCRQISKETVDFFGDKPFVEHYNSYKEDAYKALRLTMDENDENLNPTDFFISFTLGIIYQIVKRCNRNRQEKVKIYDEILSLVDTDSSLDGAYVFKYMEDFAMEESTMLAVMMHLYTDLGERKAMGWVMLVRAIGTYELETHAKNNALQEAFNFIIGMDNYLVDKYPFSEFGQIAADYVKEVSLIIEEDIDQNVTIVDESGREIEKTVKVQTKPSDVYRNKKSFFQRLFGK